MLGNFRTISPSLRQRLCNSLALPFSELLEISELDELVKNSKVKFYHRLYTPLVTILDIIGNSLHRDVTR